jgi:hypothetical protein
MIEPSLSDPDPKDTDAGSEDERRRPPWDNGTRPMLPVEPVVVVHDRVVRRQGGGLWALAAVAIAALLVALFSLGLNLFLFREILTAREETRAVLDGAIAGLEDAELGDIAFNYVFSETIAYSGTIPVSETVVFPFQGTVPFQGSVPFQGIVPISFDIPLFGRQEIRVPVNTTVDVDTSVDVSTTVTIPISMDFPFSIEIPVEIPVDLTISLDEQPALGGLLQQIRDALIEFRDYVLQ